MTDTIFALSSGAPPAAIGVVRVTGPRARDALLDLAGRVPAPRRAALAWLRDRQGAVIDEALVLWLPGPGTETGEDTVELQCHGGRAVIAAVETALAAIPGLRRAKPGEFTRRAFLNGKIDLAEAEGLADLLEAETELQRLSAMAMAGGAFSREVQAWREELLNLSAAVEAVLDFADEDDVATLPADFALKIEVLGKAIRTWLERPRAELLKEGFRVVVAGPPNAGKSTLFNCLVEAEAAIATPIAGTTRDVLTRPVAIAGVPFLFADTAGLHDSVDDVVEAIGIERALEALDRADLVLWLGPEEMGPPGAWEIEAQTDKPDHLVKEAPRHRISARTGQGIGALRVDLIETASQALPRPGEAALNERQHDLLSEARTALAQAAEHKDPLLIAEALRLARVSFDTLLGQTATEDMLDALFGRFCIGK
ncbi:MULTISPECIES: tRNA uridine-5-carboxymethylaminomethyl(34) synthesis GTPase MnmE [unclassified Novosphingobium]|uniref:tRNA uridine-5-carboxymethylaminomethyl(34) synthesis GTPase MnmE n=1 Tax=unclassified Novosphingobium TaxID=2644732 RepID=UPI000EDE3BB5|nr:MULTISPECIES: tRNA uridine-5-carboxymethylaminomethyl(34) synthesis GTPase MnmE [unclassified Novosphingobium]HCF25163.1 tRNA uridine-5-carboxymethylaminomethyl(34) synthesis GTPase MnmE [Novosphingobium sp.]HQV02427.1 tRNA uridine-5-carboxymethylaminomethyl(34) synthesis GTPase MnmE [Novosphingobium sp.]